MYNKSLCIEGCWNLPNSYLFNFSLSFSLSLSLSLSLSFSPPILLTPSGLNKVLKKRESKWDSVRVRKREKKEKLWLSLCTFWKELERAGIASKVKEGRKSICKKNKLREKKRRRATFFLLLTLRKKRELLTIFFEIKKRSERERERERVRENERERESKKSLHLFVQYTFDCFVWVK